MINMNDREYYRGKAIQIIKSEIDNVEIFILDDDKEKGLFSAMAFRGKCTKCVYYYSYKSHDRMIERAQQYIESRKKVIEMKKKRRAENKGKLSSHAAAAKEIRKELKDNFKDIKFSVRSDSFANGNSVRIEWTNGPARDEVEKIVSKYQYGHFDGMTDMYEHSNNRNDIPQVKYVQTHRNISDELRIKIREYIFVTYYGWDETKDDNQYNEHSRCYLSDFIYRFYQDKSVDEILMIIKETKKEEKEQEIMKIKSIEDYTVEELVQEIKSRGHIVKLDDEIWKSESCENRWQALELV